MTPMSPQETLAPLNGTTPVERRILLIEDSEVLSRRLVDLLTDPGSISVAAHAATQSEAISRLKEDVFDVLVVDIELAEGNGVAVVRNARQLYPPQAQPLLEPPKPQAKALVRPS